METPAAFFVYGTLKRGQINHELLAPFALSIERGSVRGTLYDLGDFPALVEGDADAWGEIVRVNRSALPRLVPVLDRLEDYQPENPAGSMYLRRVVDVRTESGRMERAFAYFYNHEHPALLPLSSLRFLDDGEWVYGWTAERSAYEGLDTYRDWVRTFAEHRGEGL